MPNPINEDIVAITPIEELTQEAKKPLVADTDASDDAGEYNDVPPHLVKKKKRWQKAISIFNGLADASNIGIIISMVSKLYPAIMVVGGGILGSISWMTDGLIYTFRALSEATRIIGKKFFGMNKENNCPFEEEKNGTHKYQTPFQLLSTALYATAVALMFGAIIASPVGVALGWGLALTGLSIATYLNYVRPANMAKDKLNQLQADPDASPKEIKAAEKDYHEKQKTKLIFVGILIGVSALMLCGTCALFAPPLIVPALLIISKIASVYLGMLNAYRVYDGIKSSMNKEEDEAEITQEKTLEQAKENTVVANSTAIISQSFKKEAAQEEQVKIEFIDEEDLVKEVAAAKPVAHDDGRLTPVTDLLPANPVANKDYLPVIESMRM